MFMNIKRDFIFALSLSAAILGYGFCGDAQAQTTQPVYIRPSKGATLTLFTKYNPAPAEGVVPPSQVSPVLDMTAFNAVQIALVSVGPGFIDCTKTVEVTVFGSLAKDGPFSAVADSFADFFFAGNSAGNFSGTKTYTVNSLPPFIKLEIKSAEPVSPTGAGNYTCNFSVSITPLPLVYRQQVEGTGTTTGYPVPMGLVQQAPDRRPLNVLNVGSDEYANYGPGLGIPGMDNYMSAVKGPAAAAGVDAYVSPVAVTSAGATVVRTLSGDGGQTFRFVRARLQNVGTKAVYCSVQGEVDTTSRFTAILKPDAASDGSGGVLETPGRVEGLQIKCKTKGADTTSVAVQVY